jgi:BirA family biotin operon repressor/biotin-[acetyl-CoA-carboxylase] ligase
VSVNLNGNGTGFLSTKNFNHIHFDEITSTNTYALNNLTTLSHNTVITADIQTHGKGRLQRHWVSNSKNNLYCSVVICPDIPFKELPLVNFTQLFSVVIAESLMSYNVRVSIKWPNDLLLNGRKICGILSETSFTGSIFNGLVIGFGINIADSPPDDLKFNLKATNILKENGTYLAKKVLLDTILKNYSSLFEGFLKSGFSNIRGLYEKYFTYLGKKIQIINSTRDVTGIASSLTDNGELEVVDSDGTVHIISLGDMQ